MSIVASCSKKSILVNNGCQDFCQMLPVPKWHMFEKNFDNDTYNFLVETSFIRECGCLVNEEEKLKCQSKYQID